MKLWSEIILPKDENKGHHKDAIVFLHGTGSNSAMWKNQIVFFSQLGYPCIAIDLRGHGSTHEPYETTGLQTHLEDVWQTLPINQIRFPVYFVGHSLGAIISLFLANKHPQLVKAVFAACLPGKVNPLVNEGFKLFMKGPLPALKGSELKNHLGWRERTLIEMPPFTLEQISANFANLDLINSVPEVNCPVHLAAGRFDPIALCEDVKKLKQIIPGSTLKIFEWGGHNFMDASADAFNAWIKSYL